MADSLPRSFRGIAASGARFRATRSLARNPVVLGILGLLTVSNLQAQTPDMPRRFQFTIAPDTPLKDLLPVPPTSKNPATPMIAKDLSQVPEVEFQMPMVKNLPS